LRERPLILAVDDYQENLDIVEMRLAAQGYDVVTASNGREALAVCYERIPDLILLDVMMPEMTGIEVVQHLKADDTVRAIPIVLLTARSEVDDVVAGLDAGADDYLTKPFDHATLVARVRSLLRIKTLYDELETLNRDLEARVNRQVEELERARSLKRFLPPQVADLIIKDGGDARILQHHRREIVVLFCDLRGFTGFAEIAEPEEVMDLLNAYHGLLGPMIHAAGGTLERFVGDGLMVFFNDPMPCPDPAEKAVRLALAMREEVTKLMRTWSLRGYSIGFGVGIAQGYATLGRIGFEGRFDYAAIGTVTNLAARLCSEAIDGQILTIQRVAAAVEGFAQAVPIGDLNLKGISRPVAAVNIEGLKADASDDAVRRLRAG
jgi:class 3 adenylate cyclase/CheY-like chemotaxis protein